MKKILLLLISLLSSLFTFSQAWYPVGAGIVGDGGVFTEATYNGRLFAGGWFYLAGNNTANNIAQWDGANWDSVGSGLTGGFNNVLALCAYNGKLYAGGAFFAADGKVVTNIAVWDGSSWDTASTAGITHCGSTYGYVDALVVYNGLLYAGGYFCYAGGVSANNIAVWNGTNWDSVSAGLNGVVSTLAVYNGKLYAGGQFQIAGIDSTAYNIACWDGTTWSSLGKGTDSTVLSLQTYNGSLYAGGEFTKAGGITAKYIAEYTDTVWSSPGAGFTSLLGVGTMCTYNGNLIAAGLFSKNGTLKVNNIATWNGTTWDSLDHGIDNTVNTLVVLDSTIYAGGYFTMAGTSEAENMAEWVTVGAGVTDVTSLKNDINIYPNPSSGLFTIQSSVVGGQWSVEVYNEMGQRVETQCIASLQPSSTFNIDLQNKPAGLYLYRILDHSGNLINQGKLVIEK